MEDLAMTTKEQVQKMHEESLVVDACAPSGMPYLDILAGGINAVVVTLASRGGIEPCLDQIKLYYGLIEMAPDRVMLVEEAQDILRAKQEGKFGMIFGFQNASPLGDDSTLLSIFHKLGVRVIQLTYNEANALGYGCMEPNDTGLTGLGIQVVQGMNRLGIVVDLAHTGYRTSRDAIEISEDPVIFSHANPLALKDNPRNKPDELIQLLAEKGGIIGLMPHPYFSKSAPGKRPTMEDFFEQVDYVVQLVGVDHVGIGTDKREGRTDVDRFVNSICRYPKALGTVEGRKMDGFSHIRDWPNITEGLLSRGYSDEDCAKIIGGNCYSLFQRVWKNPGF
jgi:membrane dipeptidase